MDVGDHYVEVPAKNVLMEFYMQSVHLQYFHFQASLLLAIILTAFPYIWRAINGKPSFANSHQKNLEMVMLFPKWMYYTTNILLLMMAKSVVHKKMHLK